MAIGAMTLVQGNFSGPHQTVYVDEITLVGDTSYPTGGMTGVEAALQALTKDKREIIQVEDADLNGGYISRWVGAPGAKKLMLLKGNGAAVLVQETNGTNVSGVTFRLTVFSR